MTEWRDNEVMKIVRIILKRFANVNREAYREKMNLIGNVVIRIENNKCFFTEFRTITLPPSEI